MSPTTGASTAQVQEELMLCQTWSKYCGLRRVVFPSGDVWIQPPKKPGPSSENVGWILVGGENAVSFSSNGANKSRRFSESVGTENIAGGHNDTPEGEHAPSRHYFNSIRPPFSGPGFSLSFSFHSSSPMASPFSCESGISYHRYLFASERSDPATCPTSVPPVMRRKPLP